MLVTKSDSIDTILDELRQYLQVRANFGPMHLIFPCRSSNFAAFYLIKKTRRAFLTPDSAPPCPNESRKGFSVDLEWGTDCTNEPACFVEPKNQKMQNQS